MKFKEAIEIMRGKPLGFRVHFEHAGDGFLRGDYFPDRDGEMITSEIEAWRLANSFAAETKGKCVNIYVTDRDGYPVKGYKEKEIVNR